MSDASPAPKSLVAALHTTALRLHGRLSIDAFHWRARLQSAWRRAPTLRVLVAPHPHFEPRLRKSLHGHAIRLTVSPLEQADLAAHDLVVPLQTADALWLADRRDTLSRHHQRLPVCRAEVVRLCDDKLALNRRLIALGFGECVPALLPWMQWPCVLKGRWSTDSAATHLIRDADDAARHAGSCDEAAYFCQEAVHDPREYASHLVVENGRIRHHLTNEYHCREPLFINGGRVSYTRRLVSTPHLDLLERMLAAIGFEGLCCVDYKVRDGRLQLLEINPRLGGSLAYSFGAFMSTLAG